MVENIETAVYQNLSELITSAKMDEMTGDFPAFKEKLKKIAQIAEILGVDTQIISVAINIKTGDTVVEIVEPDSPVEFPGTDIVLKKVTP